jgi:hypothetical protein
MGITRIKPMFVKNTNLSFSDKAFSGLNAIFEHKKIEPEIAKIE